MSVIYTDAEIAALIAERKRGPKDWRSRLRFSSKRGHDEWQMDVRGANGGAFSVIIRKSQFNQLDFSVVLAVRVPRSSRIFHLRRYDGVHWHTNRLESTRRSKNRFRDFHIHTATERYQVRGLPEDGYAEVTDRYSDLAGALDCLVADAGFDTGLQISLPLPVSPEV